MRLWLCTVLLAVAACSPEPATQAEPQPQPQVEPTPVASPSESDTAGETGDAQELPVEDDVIEIAGEGKRDRNLVPVEPVTLTPAEVTWREMTRLPEADFELLGVASGIVGRSSSGIHEFEKDKLVIRPELTVPDVQLLGHWPSDVWYVVATPLPANADGRPMFEYEAFRLDRDRQWVAQKYKKKLRFSGEALHKGWHAGMLIREGSSLGRIGSRKNPPRIGMRMGKIVLDTIESASGRLYNVSQRPNGIYVQEACFTQSCVEDNARKLPPGGEWSFATQIPRERNSFSMVATVKVEGVMSHQLLHYERGGWSLEPLDRLPSGMWPADDGGLWIAIGSELRHRTSKGAWYAIALPEGAGKFTAAMRADLRELWIASTIGEETVVFATAAIVEGLPTPR
jgi:hypothetical protein